MAYGGTVPPLGSARSPDQGSSYERTRALGDPLHLSLVSPFSGSAQAADVLYACYTDGGGKVRMVSSLSECGKKETGVS
jgi:hypothetical protein